MSMRDSVLIWLTQGECVTMVGFANSRNTQAVGARAVTAAVGLGLVDPVEITRVTVELERPFRREHFTPDQLETPSVDPTVRFFGGGWSPVLTDYAFRRRPDLFPRPLGDQYRNWPNPELAPLAKTRDEWCALRAQEAL